MTSTMNVALKQVDEFLDSELNDRGLDWEYSAITTLDNDESHFKVNIWNNPEHKREVFIKYSEGKLFLDMGDDHWEPAEPFSIIDLLMEWSL